MAKRMTPDEIAAAKAEGLVTVMKAGPLRNGTERGHGTIWHLAPGPYWNGRKALCGAAPSIQWARTWRDDQHVTCPTCIKLNNV